MYQLQLFYFEIDTWESNNLMACQRWWIKSCNVSHHWKPNSTCRRLASLSFWHTFLCMLMNFEISDTKHEVLKHLFNYNKQT